MGKVKIENIETVNPKNNDEKSPQTEKSAAKKACEKIEEDDSLRQIEESNITGDYTIEFKNAEEIRLDFIEDSLFNEEIASLGRSKYTNKYKKSNSK